MTQFWSHFFVSISDAVSDEGGVDGGSAGVDVDEHLFTVPLVFLWRRLVSKLRKYFVFIVLCHFL
jgi:hypothetical protein